MMLMCLYVYRVYLRNPMEPPDISGDSSDVEPTRLPDRAKSTQNAQRCVDIP